VLNSKGGEIVNDKNTGMIMIVLAVILAILYLVATSLLVYFYWFSIIVIFIYGLYLFMKT
jgi:hypothetical protein